MDILLTPKVLGYLIKHGYKYCMAKFELQDSVVSITLLPAKRKPLLSVLRKKYDHYYSITEEPFQMVSGLIHAGSRIYIKLNKQELQTYTDAS
ncbi:hypothetical protein HH214_00985 [Mucilaginibacter robiniae]|uniref:Uncharacterized protein n=1 Tax=Mucilaginibacter robiniae TaxID=2728022 RepID=A0A7L5E2H4_9SPHI|nr:hypothetical protein [Mucilaginibacter robiniae]QJD94546.1 hypothetical protein HH214_00985 [Mucilaginibacter robiniae]